MSPNETVFLEGTSKLVKSGMYQHHGAGRRLTVAADVSHSSFVQFQIWDFPGQLDFFDPSYDEEALFGGVGALVFVIDAQARAAALGSAAIRVLLNCAIPQTDYNDALAKLHNTIKRASKVGFAVLYSRICVRFARSSVVRVPSVCRLVQAFSSKSSSTKWTACPMIAKSVRARGVAGSLDG
jgi:hypothetical protein